MAGLICGTICMNLCCDPCGGGCMSRSVPWLPSHLTPERITLWLQQSGGLEKDNKVRTVDLKPFAIGEGLMSIMYRVTVVYEYAPKNGLKTAFVCKLSPPAAKPRVLGALLSLFEAEVNFYNKGLKEATKMDAPNCYYAGSASNGRYCILLEDLSPAKAGQQLAGVKIEHAREATKTLAKFHAKYRGKMRTEKVFEGWLLRQDDRAYWKLVKGSYVKAAKTVQPRIDNVFKTPNVDGFSQIAVKFGDNFDKWMELVCLDNKELNPNANSQLTLTHGDFRAENMFFDAPTSFNGSNSTTSAATGGSKDDGGDGGGGLGMRLVDFQLLKESSGPAELCYFVGTSMTIEDRRKYEVELLQLYYDEMKANGSDINMTQILLEYQAGLATSLIIYTIGQKDTQVDSERAKELMRVSQQRTWSQIQDWNYETAMSKIWGMPVTEVIGRSWSESELSELIPAKYLALRGVSTSEVEQKV